MSLKPKLPTDRRASVPALPRISPSESMTGPDVIVGTLREFSVGIETGIGKLILWDDCLQRKITVTDNGHAALLLNALKENKSVQCVIEKLRGKWTVTSVKEL